METLKENEMKIVKIKIKNPVYVRDMFGKLKGWKRPTEEIVKEARAGWLSATDRERESKEDSLEALAQLGIEKLKHKSIFQLKKEAREEMEKNAH